MHTDDQDSVTQPVPEDLPTATRVPDDWSAVPPFVWREVRVPPRPSTRSLYLAVFLFLLALCTCLAAGTQFAVAYQKNQAASFEELLGAFQLFYKNPSGLAAGIPFALTLLAILLAHELGHFFACRYHHIHSTYPFFVPFPNFNGTFGAFILIRSPIRTNRALFDVGASGPLVGFAFALPALIYGVLHAKVVPGLANPAQAEVIYGTPILMRFLQTTFHPGVSPEALLLPPIGRAAWVALFVTSLNLVPVAQLDGGHILRSLNFKAHRWVSLFIPLFMVLMGVSGFRDGPLWNIWSFWGVLLLVMRFLRVAPIHDPTPLDSKRRWTALLTFVVFLISFMPMPFVIPPHSS